MKTIAVLLLGTLATAGCYPDAAGPQVPTSASASAPLPAYATFSFGLTASTPSGYEVSSTSLEDDQRLSDVIGAALQQRGYVEDHNRPQFLVRAVAGTRQVVSNPAVEADPLGATHDDVMNLERIKIAIYDATTQAEVWQGSASAMVNPAAASAEGRLRNEVQAALATFPARSLAAREPSPSTASRNESVSGSQSDVLTSASVPASSVHASR